MKTETRFIVQEKHIKSKIFDWYPYAVCNTFQEAVKHLYNANMSDRGYVYRLIKEIIIIYDESVLAESDKRI